MKTCPKCSGTFPSNFSVCPQDATPLRFSSELVEGAILRGKYQILSRIGEGGMGVVYKARHIRFDEICALKLVSTHLAADEEFLRRFHAEAVLMRRLEHPHALRVHDIDETEDGRPFIVMEYFEGRSLDKLVREEGRLPVARACRIVAQACSALDAAHRLGIVHRDIKPSNILVAHSPGGEIAKVFDFGIAKVKDTSELHQGVSLTRTGFLVGTPAYMSPEQAQGVRGDKLDGRSDLYSLGIVLFEILTGQLPFQEETPASLLVAHLQAQPPDPRDLRADIPAPLSAVILRALEKDPVGRFATAVEMQVALDAISGESTAGMATMASPGLSVPRVTQPRTPIPHAATPPPGVSPSRADPLASPQPAGSSAAPSSLLPAQVSGAQDAREHSRTRSFLAKIAASLGAVILISAVAIFLAVRPQETQPATPAPLPATAPEPASQLPPTTERVPNLQPQSSRMTASASPGQSSTAPSQSAATVSPQAEPQPSATAPAPVTPAPATSAPVPQSPAPPRPSPTEVPGTVDLNGYLDAIAASADGAREIIAPPPGFVDGELDPEDAPPGFQLLRARHRMVNGVSIEQMVIRSQTEVLSVFLAPPQVPMGVGPYQIVPVNLGGMSVRQIANPGYTAYVLPFDGFRILIVGKAVRPERMAVILRAFMAGN